ncbi:MAG: alkaline phosphatase family protein [Chloroflexi bacterium]|nr:alkaline phosphatase family protein [Chloroflexota bacterium]
MHKVILVLSDALRYDIAKANMGYLGHLVEKRLATLYRISGELPSMSRPMYETIHTGLPSHEHGLVANSINRLSNKPNLFQVISQAGKVTAAAAYYWFSELYNRSPYNPIEDREVDNPSLPIQHGRFYETDEYPDRELFASAANLIRRFTPDYLLLHPMGMDYHGETYGSDSKEYRSHAVHQDAWLAPLIQDWIQNGYIILVSGDHGINSDGIHGGTTREQREVPLFCIHPSGKGMGESDVAVSQLQVAPTILKLLDVPIPSTMKSPPFAF